MVSETQLGEYIVGAYHKLVTDCEVVSYNQRSKEAGDQLEIDVIGINSEGDQQTIYTCEVVTHIRGTLYPGTPSTDRWEEFGNSDYQYTLEKLWAKFVADHGYVTEIFDDADRYVFQLWSPYISKGYLTNGLDQLSQDFHSETIALYMDRSRFATIAGLVAEGIVIVGLLASVVRPNRRFWPPGDRSWAFNLYWVCGAVTASSAVAVGYLDRGSLGIDLSWRTLLGGTLAGVGSAISLR